MIIELSEAMSLKPIEILSAASPINDFNSHHPGGIPLRSSPRIDRATRLLGAHYHRAGGKWMLEHVAVQHPESSGSALLTESKHGDFRIVGVLVGLLVLSSKEEGVVDALAVPSSTNLPPPRKRLFVGVLSDVKRLVFQERGSWRTLWSSWPPPARRRTPPRRPRPSQDDQAGLTKVTVKVCWCSAISRHLP